MVGSDQELGEGGNAYGGLQEAVGFGQDSGLEEERKRALGDELASGGGVDFAADPEPAQEDVEAAGLQRDTHEVKLEEMDGGDFERSESRHEGVGVVAGVAEELAELLAFDGVQRLQHSCRIGGLEASFCSRLLY